MRVMARLLRTLMKASGVEVLMSSEFGGITSTINGKAWTTGIRLIMTVLLQHFYSNSAKT